MATRASHTRAVQKLEFAEKLVQTGKKENSDALLKRLKVGDSFGGGLCNTRWRAFFAVLS